MMGGACSNTGRRRASSLLIVLIWALAVGGSFHTAKHMGRPFLFWWGLGRTEGAGGGGGYTYCYGVLEKSVMISFVS